MTRPDIDTKRLHQAFAKVRSHLLAQRNASGHWEGRLSSSALSTATAVCALSAVRKHDGPAPPNTESLVSGGVRWLVKHQNEDGGWGDTTISFSNISTTTLCWAALGIAGADSDHPACTRRAEAWLTQHAGGIDRTRLAQAIVRRYGKDKTFSIPILTLCAISGRFGEGREAWQPVKQLPFELAALPQSWFAALRLPVVSYALPALIAIGHARHRRRPTTNPLARLWRNAARNKTLRVLERIQPDSGGFLEAAPLTSFVAMSLAAAGQARHPVTEKCIGFLERTARPDGSWPIDTNLATWATTLAVNALANDPAFAGTARPDLTPAHQWLLKQQYSSVHPYTNAAPGGWAWTDLSGGVPDADDTSGALLALHQLDDRTSASVQAALNGARWLIDLQNSDGGIPTFCRGWTNLPFDRSSPDITAHALRGIGAWNTVAARQMGAKLDRWTQKAVAYLNRVQNDDGSWNPLWFGNQHEPTDELNPTYGTSKVVLALAERQLAPEALERGANWLLQAQGENGGWSGFAGGPPSVEETALAIDALTAVGRARGDSDAKAKPSNAEIATALRKGVDWLLDAVESGEWTRPAPIGFYFAKLWYYEELYPAIFTVGALGGVQSLLDG